MGAISPLHVLIVLIVALVVLGPRKLPETGAAIGKAIREFRMASHDEPAAAEPMPAAVPDAAVAAPAQPDTDAPTQG